MAGSTVTIKRQWSTQPNLTTGAPKDAFSQLYLQHNNLILDVEVLRAGSIALANYRTDELAAGADITERAFFRAERAITIVDSVGFLNEAASVGVDGSNTLAVTLRNITEAVDIATIVLTADTSANARTAMTLTAANADIAANDIIGVVVTQGATADVGRITLQFEYQPQTIDAAADLVAATLSTIEQGD